MVISIKTDYQEFRFLRSPAIYLCILVFTCLITNLVLAADYITVEDNIPPALTIETADDGAQLNSSPIIVDGTTSDDDGVDTVVVEVAQTEQGPVTATITGTDWTTPEEVQLANEKNTITVTATDIYNKQT